MHETTHTATPKQSLLRNPGWSTNQGLVFLLFHALRKMLETCIPMTFPDFLKYMNGDRVILQKCPWRPTNRKLGAILPSVTWCVANFVHSTTLTFQCDFKCKIFLAKCDLGNLMCEESSYTVTWYEEKTDLKCAWRFLRANKNSPLWKRLFWGTV